MSNGLASLFRDEHGAIYVEYLIVTLTVSLPVMFAIAQIGLRLWNHYRFMVVTLGIYQPHI